MKLALFAAVLAVLTLAGCPDEVANDRRPNCLIDVDCASGLVCVDGYCSQKAEGCIENADCDNRDVCRGSQGARTCVAPVDGGECTGDDGCEPTARCTAALPGAEADCLVSVQCARGEPDAGCDDACYGHCVEREHCNVDGDCEVTETCSGNFCLPIGDCGGDADCPATAACVAGSCTQNGDCAIDEDCAANESCVDGACTRNETCATNGDCPADQRCADGVCLRRDPCTTDDGCDFDEHCDRANDGGTCVIIGPCTTVDDCPNEPGVACLDGSCTRAPCGRDSECDDGLFCNGAETCNPRVGCASGAPPTTANLPGCANESCDEATDTLVLTPVDNRCSDGTPCTDDICDVGLGCLNPANAFVPPPGPADDCVQTVCRDGGLKSVPNDAELPSDQGSATDCQRAVCSAGARVLVANDAETPLQGAPNDCLREVCSGGASTRVADDGETPPQGPNNDCKREVCSGGVSTQVANDIEVPTQGPSNDCKREVCAGGVSTQVANNSETPPQGATTDCKREICSGGVSSQVADNTQRPVGVGCKDGTCVNGTPTQVRNDGNCTDAAVCTVGSCNVDGSCTQTPDDGLCSCGGNKVGLCLPADQRAPSSGNLAGCVCLQPAVLSCGLDDGVSVKRVFARFELFATAPGAAAGSRFTWDIAGTPVGGDPAAQVLGNATSATAAFFQATSPSAVGVKDWQLRVTLREPELPPQSCIVSVEAQRIPDTLEVTLSMQNAVDVDIHLIGGPGRTLFDFPFHEQHDPLLDNENRDCYWDNCPVCSVSIPGQSCVPVNPRRVDFDGDGASLADLQDPQLDIDNTRGCFTGENGELSCVPEKITVEQPATGSYIIWPYLWGPPNAELSGLLTSPATVTVTIDVQCRGQTVRVTRSLSSALANGAAAPAKSSVRYGTNNGFILVDVPATGACSILP